MKNMRQSYSGHSDEADRIAKRLLLEDAEKRHREVRSHALNIASWGSHLSPTSARGLVELADALDVPIFRLAFVTVFVVAVLYGVAEMTHWLSIDGFLVFLWVYVILLSLTIAYKLMRMSVRTARLRASVDGGSDKLAIARGVASTLLLLLGVVLTITLAYVVL